MADYNCFLTMELLSEVLEEFAWPRAYSLEDDLPDGILMSFPRSIFAFCEGTEGIHIRFLAENTKGVGGLGLMEALMFVGPESAQGRGVVTPGLICTVGLPRKKDRIKDELRNQCRMILAHLTAVIDGDFSWVDKLLTKYTHLAHG